MTTSERLPISWANVHATTCDDVGNVYLLTSDSETSYTLSSLDPQRRLRWTTAAPDRWAYMVDGNKMSLSAWSSSGALVLWTRGRHSAHVISCRDGGPLGLLGHVQGDRHVDLLRTQSLAVDRDGTLLAVAGGVLRRFTSVGASMQLWEGDGLVEAELGPTNNADHLRVIVGWDGATWVTTYRSKGMLWGENTGGSFPRWRRFDRRGQTLAWSEELFLLREADAAWADRNGHAYAQWLLAASYPRVMRYAPDVSSFEYWLVSSKGPHFDPTQFDANRLRPTRPSPITVGAEHRICVAPDGSIWAFGSLDALRCFGPDGTPTFVSAASGAAE